MRLRLDLAYEGTDFHGWAAQPSLRTVEGLLAEALTRVLRTEPVRLTCAGRTDTGVHARGQVVHLDLEPGVLEAAAGRSTRPPAQALLRSLNGVLPPDVRVLAAAEAPPGFDARFSALWRRYAYRIADEPATYDPVRRRAVLHWPRRLDVDAMQRGARTMLGEHDFAAFCRGRPGATTVRTLQELGWVRHPPAAGGLVVARVRADAFCHHMVRALVGCLITVGEGRRPESWPADVLRRGVRDGRVTVVHPHGLTLEEVGYPADAELGSRARAARRVRDDTTRAAPVGGSTGG